MEEYIGFGPNAVNFVLTMGGKRWYMVGAYAPPRNVELDRQSK